MALFRLHVYLGHIQRTVNVVWMRGAGVIIPMVESAEELATLWNIVLGRRRVKGELVSQEPIFWKIF